MLSTLLLAALALPQQGLTRTPVEPVPQQGAEDPAQTTLTIYDVRDVVEQLAFGSEEPNALLDARDREQRDHDRKRAADVLARALRDHVTPRFVVDVHRVQIQTPGALVVTATPAQQAWVEAFLRALRGRDRFVMLDTRILEGPRGVFRDTSGVEGNRFFDTERELESYLSDLKALPGLEQVVAPRIMTPAGTRASIATTNEVSYVRSWTLRVVEPGGQEIADPEIAVIHEGVTLEVRVFPIPRAAEQDQAGAWVVPPGMDFAIDLDIEQARIARPIPTRTMRLSSASSDREVEISVPEVTNVALEAEVRLARGAGLLIGGPSTEEDRDVAILISLPEVELPLHPEDR